MKVCTRHWHSYTIQFTVKNESVTPQNCTLQDKKVDLEQLPFPWEIHSGHQIFIKQVPLSMWNWHKETEFIGILQRSVA